MERCVAGSLLSRPVDLSDLFHPAVFLNALRQETARRVRVPINSLHFINEWGGGAPIPGGTTCPVQVEGLQLEGALFDGHLLADCTPDSPSATNCPTCTVAWVVPREGKGRSSHEMVRVPIYLNSMREHEGTSVVMPCTGSPDIWKLRSVALVLKNQ